MSDSPLDTGHRLLTEAVEQARAAAGPGASDAELLSVLTLCEGASRQLDRLTVDTVATLERRGTFAERGYRTAAGALSDLLGWERFEARRRVVAAEQVCERVGLDGTTLPARLPTTAQVFTAGQASLRHVEVVARVLATPAAARLSPAVWAGAEDELADKATVYTPTELATWGTALVEVLDADGPAPDHRDPAPVDELFLQRRRDGNGGTLKGTFESASLYDAIATLIDAHAKPVTGDDHRSVPQRQAEALGEICGYVLDHGGTGAVPASGGFRPHLNVLIRLEDLEDRARAAMLDFGGVLTPAELRHLACDCSVVPIVMDGAGQPLDVGRATRTIPDGLRRAVTARDRGCARPGCGRPPSWCEVHHCRPWEDGGETRLDNCVLLCKSCHRLIHHSGWSVHIRDGGLPEFLPPTWIDPHQQPRQRPLPHLAAGA